MDGAKDASAAEPWQLRRRQHRPHQLRLARDAQLLRCPCFQPAAKTYLGERQLAARRVRVARCCGVHVQAARSASCAGRQGWLKVPAMNAEGLEECVNACV